MSTATLPCSGTFWVRGAPACASFVSCTFRSSILECTYPTRKAPRAPAVAGRFTVDSQGRSLPRRPFPAGRQEAVAKR
ncbi:hypothetical protein K270103H11_19310 [Gordonibacter urolithinfaciens]